VNVGAADGYYAVGLALRMPEAGVQAFEVDEGRRDLCEELARVNGVAERIDLAGACDPEWLAALEGDCLLVMDCEGCEVSLLGPEQAANLAGSGLIVELHDFIDPRSCRSVVQRFSATHQCERIAATPRHSGRLSRARVPGLEEPRARDLRVAYPSDGMGCAHPDGEVSMASNWRGGGNVSSTTEGAQASSCSRE
jgi:hypothetical protein